MTTNRTPGVWWQPRTKRELIVWIVKSGRWKEKKQKLLNMDIKEVRGKYNGIRQQIDNEWMSKKHFDELMRKPVHLDNGQAQVGDKTKEVDNG